MINGWICDCGNVNPSAIDCCTYCGWWKRRKKDKRLRPYNENSFRNLMKLGQEIKNKAGLNTHHDKTQTSRTPVN